ncbi:hypothetical protein ACFY0F_29015 [Streptomyces sp. NPDC001544]|uniref:hypothetical protein n=1 Tax=Streptomyces sp. NPDC001544 TaxID=3364584 RepID=UPI00369E77DF
MRRARMTVVAMVTGAALSLLGTGVASAGTGPAPSTPNTQTGTAGTEAGNPASSAAQAAGVCSDAYQIGTTSYIYRGPDTIASVKQFYSPNCNKNYGYLWVWKSFLDKNINFDVKVGVWSYKRNFLVGQRLEFGTHAQEFWGNAADTTGECTSGEGTLTLPNEAGPYTARSSQRC